jgi:hypothetical protein
LPQGGWTFPSIIGHPKSKVMFTAATLCNLT